MLKDMHEKQQIKDNEINKIINQLINKHFKNNAHNYLS